MAKLILVRHGQSLWNAKNLWTGLTDIELSEKGKQEARNAATLLETIHIDTVYTSNLIRAWQTLVEIQNILFLSVPVVKTDALNERDYGDLTGKNKLEIKEKFGQKQYLKWRRSWDFPIPNGESLKDVYNRVIPYYQNTILKDLKNGKNVLVVAHGNSLRALMKYLENISDKDIPRVEMKTGDVFVYTIDPNGEVQSKEILS